MPTFVQTDSQIVEITKITHITPGPKTVTIHFVGGSTLRMPRSEAAELLETVTRLSGVQAVRAPASAKAGRK